MCMWVTFLPEILSWSSNSVRRRAPGSRTRHQMYARPSWSVTWSSSRQPSNLSRCHVVTSVTSPPPAEFCQSLELSSPQVHKALPCKKLPSWCCHAMKPHALPSLTKNQGRSKPDISVRLLEPNLITFLISSNMLIQHYSCSLTLPEFFPHISLKNFSDGPCE